MSRTLITTGSPFERKAGYSRAVADGPWCFVSGTTGYDYTTMTMPAGAARQTAQALATIADALRQAGFGLEDVVRARYVVSDRANVEAVLAALGDVFADIRPAATMIIADLIDPNMLVEIDVTAYRPGSESGTNVR